MQSWPAEKRKRAIGIAAHGDEGQGKKDKSVLVLSWSSFGVHKRSTSCKFPFAVSGRALYVRHIILNCSPKKW